MEQSYTDAVDGIFANGLVKRSALLIDSSTIDPGVSRRLCAQAKQLGFGHGLVDAPVSGGVGGAQAGTLTFMVGSSAATLQQVNPYLAAMGKNIVHCGESGNGLVAKICNNLILGISMAGVSEAMNLGIKLGIDPQVLASVVNTSSGRCWSSDTYNPVPGVMPNVPASRGYTGGFGVDLMAKDLSLATSAAHGSKQPLPLGSLTLALYDMISSKGYSSKDFASIYDFLQKNN